MAAHVKAGRSGRTRRAFAPLDDAYLSQVAHELRGSLNAVLGWAELLRMGRCADGGVPRAAETIIRHARQQAWMLAELFDVCRLAGGTLTLAASTFPLRAAVDGAVAALRPVADGKSVRLEARLGLTSEHAVVGDAKRLRQALLSLLSNSLHFTPPGGVVTVEAAAGDDGVLHVQVSDGGPGIAPEALPHVFDRAPAGAGAVRARRAQHGLGLSYARDMVELHGGTLRAESGGEAAGVTFHLQFPRADRPGARRRLRRERAEKPALAAPPLRLSGLRVLLVDDEEDAREALAGILAHYGAEVVTADSAAAALTALQNGPVDVLLADIGMPGMDGYQLIRNLREHGERELSRVPAVAVTAFTTDADRRRALDAGYQVHLAKPIDPVTLVATVAALSRPAEQSEGVAIRGE